MATINHLEGYAFAKKKGDTIHVFEGPHTLADFMPVVADGTDVPRMLKDRFSDIVNVMDFGAKGNGSADDTEAIQAAFASIEETGGTVLFPAGRTYCVSDEVQLGGNVTVIAYGAKIKAIGGADESFGLFSNWLGCTENPPTGFAGNSNICWFGGDIDCGGASVNANTYRWAMMFAHGENIHVWHANFRDSRRVHTGEFSACRNSGFHFCNFYGQFPPVVENYYPEVVQIDANTTSSSDRNPDNTTCDGIAFENCLFTNRENTSSITASSPYCGVGAHGSLAGQVFKNVSVRNCVFKGVRRTGCTGTSSCFNGYTIENNVFIGCGYNAIDIQPGSVDGTEDIENFIVRGNTFVDLGGDFAVRILGSTTNKAKNIIIENNVSSSTGAFCNIQRAENVDVRNNVHSLSATQTSTAQGSCYFNAVNNLVLDGLTLNVGSYAVAMIRAVIVSTDCYDYRIGRITTDLSQSVLVTATTITQDGLNGSFSGPQSFNGFVGVTTEGSNNSTPAIALGSPQPYNCPHIGYDEANGFRIGSYKTTEDGKSVLDERVLYISSTENGGNFGPGDDNARSCGFSSNRWTQIFAATAAVNTSDYRCKTSISNPTDALLNAWGSVGFKVFQFTDAVEKKGSDGARFHVGVIAQDVQTAFASQGLDASKYGLFCYDSWGDEYETIEVVDQEEVLDEDGSVVTPRITHTEQKLVTAAGDRYGIRYEEALALECAYLRRQLQKIEAALAANGITV